MQCQRCLQKGIVCSYDNHDKKIAQTPPPVLNVLPGSNEQLTSNTEDLIFDDFVSSTILDHSAPNLVDFSSQDSGILLPKSTSSFESSLTLVSSNASPSSVTETYHLHIEPNQDWSSIFRLDPYISSLIPNEVDKWVLRPAPMPNPLAQNHSWRLIRMLRSIPRMMVRRENFPPFIHSHWQHDLPGPLANCMKIAQLFCTRNSGNSALVWNTIRLEQERLARETYDFTKEDLMAGLQAYLVYMIMRAEDDTSQTAGDVPMLFSLKASPLVDVVPRVVS